MVLLDQGGYGCVFYPSKRCDGKDRKTKKYITKIQIDDYNAQNELHIGALIRSIPKWNHYFSPLEEQCNTISYKELHNDEFKECDILTKYKDRNLKYIFYRGNYIKGDTLRTLFNKKLKHTDFIQTTFKLFYKLLFNINHLLSKSIIHFDFRNDNIIYNKVSHLPIVIDFGLSFTYEMMIDTPENVFIKYDPGYIIYAPEIHFISYLLFETKTVETTKENIINRVVKDIMSHHKVLNQVCSKTFMTQYEIMLRNYFESIYKEDVHEMIRDAPYKTWDQYAASMMMINYINKKYETLPKDRFLFLYMNILVSCIMPDANARSNIEETKKQMQRVPISYSMYNIHPKQIKTDYYDLLSETKHFYKKINKNKQHKNKS